MKKFAGFLLSLPIFFKIMCVGAMVTTLFSVVTVYQFKVGLTRFLYSDLREKTLASARSISDAVAHDIAVRDVMSIYETLKRQKTAMPDIQYIYVLGADGNMLAHIPFHDTAPVAMPVSGNQTDVVRLIKGEGHYTIEAQSPLFGGKAGWVKIGVSDAGIRKAFRTFTTALVTVLVVCIIFGHGMAFFLASVMVKPINQLTRASRRIREGDLTARAGVHSTDEIGKLAETFDQMAESLKKNQEEIERKESERRVLVERLVQVHEEEKRHIARELHDHVGPSLSSILLRVESLSRTTDGNTEGIRGDVGELSDMVRGAIEDMRKMAFTLRPDILDDFGLESAMKQYVDFFRKHADVRVEFSYAEMSNSNRLPEAVETAFYRILQEALSNVRRHSKARHVSVIVIHGVDEATLVIEDDGIGVSAVDSTRSTDGGMGIAGMRDRAFLLRGTFSIDSEPGKGTGIRVSIPL